MASTFSTLSTNRPMGRKLEREKSSASYKNGLVLISNVFQMLVAIIPSDRPFVGTGKEIFGDGRDKEMIGRKKARQGSGSG